MSRHSAIVHRLLGKIKRNRVFDRNFVCGNKYERSASGEQSIWLGKRVKPIDQLDERGHANIIFFFWQRNLLIVHQSEKAAEHIQMILIGDALIKQS